MKSPHWGEGSIRILPGQYFDRETGLAYNFFRDYDPQTGRYLQSDPIGLQGGINPYRYGAANPISKSDVFGLCDAACQMANRAAGLSSSSSNRLELTGTIGMSGTLFLGTYGGTGEWGIARDYKNNICFYYQECRSQGGAAGVCVQGGLNLGIQRGALQTGETQQAGFFAAGGRGLGTDVQVMVDSSNSISVVKGAPLPFSLGLGFAGGFTECTTKYVCPFDK